MRRSPWTSAAWRSAVTGCALLVAAGAAGCCSDDGNATPRTLPGPGADASFAGSFSGADDYVASLGSSGTEGASLRVARIDDASTDVNLGGDSLLLQYGAAAGDSCHVPGVVTARRYDASGGAVQLPLTIATASLAPATCTLTIDGGSATVDVVEGEMQLYADGSIDVTFAGSITAWGGAPSSGTVRWTFSGSRTNAAATGP